MANKKPMIKSVNAIPSQISINDTTTLVVVAEDPDGDMLSYRWDAKSKGELITFTEDEVKWIAPAFSNRFKIEVKVTDENGGKTTGEVYVEVRGDESPIVTIIAPSDGQIISGIGTVTISADVEFKWSIGRVDFFIEDDSLLYSDNEKPYRYSDWNVATLSGRKVIIVKAYEQGNNLIYGEDSIHVFIEGVVPIPKR